MKLEDALTPANGLSSGRFFRVGYLPTYAAVVFLLVLCWAGAPARHVDFSRAWRVANDLGTVQTLLIALAVALITLLLQPFQLSLVRVLEGEFPRWLGSGLARRVQLARKHRGEAAVCKRISNATAAGDDNRDQHIQEAGRLSEQLRSRFPVPDHLVRATGLGNALAAMEDNAGSAYGLDTVAAWPRLYLLLEDSVRSVVDDLRDTMDAAARMAATAAVTAAASVLLLAWHSEAVAFAAVIPLLISAFSYVGAIRAAAAYGQAVQVAFDLYRFDLLAALRIETPAAPEAERITNVAMSDFLRQGIPMPFHYAAPDASTAKGDDR